MVGKNFKFQVSFEDKKDIKTAFSAERSVRREAQANGKICMESQSLSAVDYYWQSKQFTNFGDAWRASSLTSRRVSNYYGESSLSIYL